VGTRDGAAVNGPSLISRGRLRPFIIRRSRIILSYYVHRSPPIRSRSNSARVLVVTYPKNLPSACVGVCTMQRKSGADLALSEKMENHTHTHTRAAADTVSLYCYQQKCRGNVIHYNVIVLHFILPRAALRRVCLHTAWSDTRLLRVVVVGAMPPSINILYGVFTVIYYRLCRQVLNTQYVCVPTRIVVLRGTSAFVSCDD